MSGQSYLIYNISITSTTTIKIDVALLTNSSNGIVFFSRESEQLSSNFISLTIEDGFAVSRVNTSTGETVITSSMRVDDGEWHMVTLIWQGSIDELSIDGMPSSNIDTNGNVGTEVLVLNSILYVGGVPDGVLLPFDVSEGFIGCIRDIEINDVPVEPIDDALVGINILQCTEPECSYVVCQNGGTCMDTGSGPGFMCECPSDYDGQYCETPELFCSSNPCMFGGICSEMSGTFSCLCPLNRGGRTCEDGKSKISCILWQCNIPPRNGFYCLCVYGLIVCFFITLQM